MEPKPSLVRQRPKKRSRNRLRARRRINWAPTLVLLLLGNVAFACFNSKVTAVRTINLYGVRESERKRIERIMGSIQGRPALSIDPRVVESAFMNESRVKSADFRRNIFGISRLMLRYREAVASIAGSPKTYLDETGVIFFEPEVIPSADPAGKNSLPEIKFDPKIKVSVMAISGVINYKNVANLATLVKTNLTAVNKTENPIEIEVQETGGVCLNINNGLVDLGTCEQLPEKVQKLRQILEEQPDLFEANSSLNLMVPENPQRVPRKKENG